MNRTIEPFSAGYYAVDAEILSFTGEKVATDHELFEDMASVVEEPLLKLGTGHYWAMPEYGIPPDTVAVPDDIEQSADTPLLAKPAQVSRLTGGGPGW